VLKREFNISLEGVVNTQLLAGLVSAAAATGNDSVAIAAASSIKRAMLNDLYSTFGYPKATHKSGL
jgi:hypothetical protein